MKKYIDVTIPLTPDIAGYKDDPPFNSEPLLALKKGDSYNATTLTMSSHSGTHVDAPRHFFNSGKTIDELALDTLIGPARVIQFRGYKSITKELLEREDLEGIQRLLIKTDHSFLLDRYTRFRKNYVYLEVDACGYLVSKGIRLLGIDTFSIEKYDTKDYMGHKILLGAGVIIVELLNLKMVSPGDYDMMCLPMNLKDGDGAPARVVLSPSGG